jgi:hypothetical protein
MSGISAAKFMTSGDVPDRRPVEFRRKVLDLIEAGRPVVEVAAQLGVADQTIYN